MQLPKVGPTQWKPVTHGSPVSNQEYKPVSKQNLYELDLLCIGSGPAGQRAAVQAAKLGKRVGLIEQEFAVGGVSLHTGTIPSKPFREAVISLTVGANPFHARRKNDKQRLKRTAKELFSRVDDLIGRETHVQEDQLTRNDVEIINGAGKFQDAHTVVAKSSSGGRLIRVDNILVAVGTPSDAPGQFVGFRSRRHHQR